MNTRKLLSMAVVATGLLVVSFAAQAADPTAFETYYRAPMSINWWVVGILTALGVGLAFVFPPSAPVVWLATAIGNAMGLVGIAATNAGLALLGGGALAAGGLGMAGGAVVLAAALSFSSAVVSEFATAKLEQKFSEAEFRKAMQDMVDLPLPVNHGGSGASKRAIQEVKAIAKDLKDKGRVLNGADRTKLLERVRLIRTDREAMDPKSKNYVADQTMAALLSFIAHDYGQAAELCRSVLNLRGRSQSSMAVPSFICATTMLAREGANFSESRRLLEAAIEAESKVPALRPILLAVYWDRLFGRALIDGRALDTVKQMADIVANFKHDEYKKVAYQLLATRYFGYLKYQQQTVLAVSGSMLPQLADSQRGLDVVFVALARYTSGLKVTESFISRSKGNLLLTAHDRLVRSPAWEKEWIEAVERDVELVAQYRGGLRELHAAVDRMADRVRLKAMPPPSIDSSADASTAESADTEVEDKPSGGTGEANSETEEKEEVAPKPLEPSKEMRPMEGAAAFVA